ncbi:NB-ARC domain containing protein [Trema orientale]|uniref:NB-ARC domain containing protein n=1 Tax=Trema orientale TaxID=63057 RepID=A0A2P5D5A4_TREOI|nr:NB-ARC domain containing protein [Trema orientale]
MESAAGAVVEVTKCVSTPIGKYWKYHNGIYENMDTLKQRLEELNCRKRDIESRLNIELIPGGTMLKNEVELWLGRIEKINVEIKTIEEKVEKVKFFSRASLGRNVIQRTEEVKELHKSGEFPNSLVISLPKHGDVLPTTALGAGETTFKRKMEEIWSCLMNDEVTKIGVYGMGGIGKTTALEHINNLLLERKEKFDNVIWVTVSKDSNKINLQDKIARMLSLDITKYEDEIIRAAELLAGFDKKKRYVLILDDLWESCSLKDVGIPEPTRQNGCKLVVTTRSLDVCLSMSCKAIPMRLLSEDEALNLFLDVVQDRSLLSSPKFDEIVKAVVQECAGLPLAVVTIAGSLKGVVDFNEWEIALEDLRECTKGSASDQIFEKLKFSYDRLNDKKLQDCILYCALYPEDHQIDRNFLVELLIVEGVVEERKTRQSEIKQGQVMLNKLVNVCLLNDTTGSWGRKYVKMHDLVRDMALQITSGSPRFLVKAGLRLKSVSDEENWSDVAKVSFINNDIVDIPSSVEPPKCPNLSTLLLSNSHLKSISNNFFLHMKCLKVLDLSYNYGLQNLPESISDLVCLTALLLRSCESLQFVPSLAKLKDLRMLDLNKSGINEVPHGMKMLVKLRYLDFNTRHLKMIPARILCNLTNLQYLLLNGDHYKAPKVRGEELVNLRKLETFEGVLYDVRSFNTYVRSIEQQTLTSYVLQLGFNGTSTWRPVGKLVYLMNCDISESVAAGGEFPLLLPNDIEYLSLQRCYTGVSNLCKLASFKNVTKLRHCRIIDCREIEHVFSYSPYIFPLLRSLEYLELSGLLSFRGLFLRDRERRASSSPLPPGTFSSLKRLQLWCCNKVTEVFVNISFPPNLEELVLYDCSELREIISITSESDDEDQNEEGSVHHAMNIITLPNLRKVSVARLPKLESLPLVADSLQEIDLWDLPKLKRIPLLDRESRPSSLQRVSIHQDLWESLEWDHPNAKVQYLRQSRQ